MGRLYVLANLTELKGAYGTKNPSTPMPYRLYRYDTLPKSAKF